MTNADAQIGRCIAGLPGDRPLTLAHLRDLRVMVAEIEQELATVRLVVDKLPKDADGVPVTNDTRLYYVHPEFDEIWVWRLRLIPQLHIVPHVGDEDECTMLLPEDGHVSCEAAEAELERRKNG